MSMVVQCIAIAANLDGRNARRGRNRRRGSCAALRLGAPARVRAGALHVLRRGRPALDVGTHPRRRPAALIRGGIIRSSNSSFFPRSASNNFFSWVVYNRIVSVHIGKKI